MKALTVSEAREWATSHADLVDPRQALSDASDGRRRWRCGIPEKHSQVAWFSRLVEGALRPWGNCLFWAIEWGVWASSENWPLYYRLRESYGERRKMIDAPALLFTKDETDDLVSFLQIAVISGWDVSLVPDSDNVWIYISHDEWAEFRMKDQSKLKRVSAALTDAGRSK